MTDEAPQTEVPPFGATVAGVVALVPEVRLIPGDGPAPAGTFGITETQVRAWLTELTGVLDMTLDGWDQLSTEDTDPLMGDGGVYGSGTYGENTLGDRGKFLEAARTIIHNGAASYLEAARHPERASVNADSYSAVLWARYTTGLDRLAAWLTGRLADPRDGDDEPPTPAGAAYSFPDPMFLDLFPG